MKKLLLLIVLCAFSVTAFAQERKMSYLLNDSVLTLSSWQNVVFQPLQSKKFLPMRETFIWKENSSESSRNIIMFRPRIIVVQPLRVIIHHHSIMYGSQVIFWEQPRVYIKPMKIIYDPPAF